MARQDDDTRAALLVTQRVLDQRREGEQAVDFAGRVGISPSKLNNWKEPKEEPWRARGGVDVDTLLEVHERTGWSLHWLLTGETGGDAYDQGVRAALRELEGAEEGVRRLLGSDEGGAKSPSRTISRGKAAGKVSKQKRS